MVFYCSACKLTRCQTPRRFWHWELFLWDLLCNLRPFCTNYKIYIATHLLDHPKVVTLADLSLRLLRRIIIKDNAEASTFFSASIKDIFSPGRRNRTSTPPRSSGCAREPCLGRSQTPLKAIFWWASAKYDCHYDHYHLFLLSPNSSHWQDINFD